MVLNSTRKAFTSLALTTELLYFLSSACQTDEADLDYHAQELILNCFTILNYCVLEKENSEALLNERYTDMLITFVKKKQFYSLPAIKVIHSFSSIPFEGK
jgi:hypothetical protein